MSCTVSALPFLLLFSVVENITIAANSTKTNESIKKRIKDEVRRTLMDNNGEVTDAQIDQLCREYQTVFMDEEILVKTLMEYGLKDFAKQDGKVSARINNFNLIFHREDSSQPYKLNVYSPTSCDETMVINDLNNEYALNAQEETYIKLKERLESKNLKIYEEEVLEDDSIMLTVNLG